MEYKISLFLIFCAKACVVYLGIGLLSLCIYLAIMFRKGKESEVQTIFLDSLESMTFIDFLVMCITIIFRFPTDFLNTFFGSFIKIFKEEFKKELKKRKA